MTTTLTDYNFTQESDQIELVERFTVNVASGTAAAMAAAALATLGAAYAVGATRFGTTVKVYNRHVRHVEGVHWDVTINSRTQTFDDLIMTAASGTDIDKGGDTFTDSILRDRNPTGTVFTLGSWHFNWTDFEPRRIQWFDRVHDVYPKTQMENLVGAINSASWNGYSTGTWLCKAARTQTVRTDSGSRYLTHYEFAFDAGQWNLNVYAYTWNSRTVANLAAATLSTGVFERYKDYNFATYGFTF